MNALRSLWTLWRVARRSAKEGITLDESFAAEVHDLEAHCRDLKAEQEESYAERHRGFGSNVAPRKSR